MELLRRLTAGWSTGDGRTLFLVGDPMQSIYLFREANVGLFLQIRAHGLGEVMLEPLALVANFRSRPEVVDWINATFAPVLPAHDAPDLGAVRYSPSRSTRAAHAAAGVHFSVLAEASAAAEARHVATLVAEEQRLHGEARIEGDGSRILNMIHRDDVVGAILAALRRGRPGECYNGVDNEPVSQLALFKWLVARHGGALPPAVPVNPASERKRGLTNKRVTNRKLRSELGYEFKYPTFREGLLAV